VLADQQLLDDVLGPPGARQRRAMAKAITLLESTREDHRSTVCCRTAAAPSAWA
jgi:LAO/AO transport system kinase